MYEARQNKEKVSRRIDGGGNNSVRRRMEFDSSLNNKTKAINIFPLQFEKVTIEGIEVSVNNDYTYWEQEGQKWHLNWKDVYEDKRKNLVYHLTKEGSKSQEDRKNKNGVMHYFFCLDGNTISDPSSLPSDFSRTGKKFSKLDNITVKGFIERHIEELRG